MLWLSDLNNAPDFQCLTSMGQSWMEEASDVLQLEGGVVEEVKDFCNLCDLMDSEGGRNEL